MHNALSPAWTGTLDDYPTALAVSRDGTRVAAGTASGKVFLYDASTGELLKTLDAHANGVLAAGFGRQHLATGGQDGHARLWDVRSGEALAALPGGAGWVQHLLWTTDGKRLATGAGKCAKLWDEQGKPLREWTSASGGINGLAFNPVGGLLAAATGAEVQLWRAADGGLDRRLKWASTLLNVHWSPDGKVLACGSLDRSIHFWRAGAWTDSQMAGYDKKPQSLAWTADGRQLASTGELAIIVWNFAGKGPEGSKPLQLHGHSVAPTLLATHAKKPLLLSGGADSRMVLWQLRSGDQPYGEATLSAEVCALAFNASASLAYAADAQGRLRAFWIDAA